MTTFDKFLKANNLKKYQVAEYLGIAPANITKYSKGGRIPPAQLEKLHQHKDWDTSLLEGINDETLTDKTITMVDMMQRQMESMTKVINSLSTQLAAQQTIIERFIFPKLNEENNNEGA